MKHDKGQSDKRSTQGKGSASDKGSASKDRQIRKGHENEDRPAPDEEPVKEAGFDPDKTIRIDDNPEETKRKIPNMSKTDSRNVH